MDRWVLASACSRGQVRPLVSAERVTVFQVVDAQGKDVMDATGNWRMFQIVEDGQHEGERGTVFTLHELTGRPLHWNWNRVILAEDGREVRRAEVSGNDSG